MKMPSEMGPPGSDWENSPPPDERTRRDFYQKLRRQVRDWAQGRDLRTQRLASIVLAAPDLFHLLCRLMADSRTPAHAKLTLGIVLAYFVSPIDLMPEAVLGPLGYVDDVALAALAIDKLVDSVGEEVIREHWAGEDDVLDLVRSIVATVNEHLSKRIVGRLKRVIR